VHRNIPLLALFFVVTAASPARAADPVVPDPAIARARADYELGTRYWDVGQYDKALDSFRSAYAHRADPALLFNVAQCLRKLKRTGEALDMYRNFLRRAPRSPKRADVERTIAVLEEELAAAPTPVTPPPAPVAPPPLVTPPPPPVAMLEAAPAPQSKPLLQRPWIWGVAAVVVAGTVTALLLATRGTERSFACEGCAGSQPVPVR
jgi:tetratricopeptide (TPR) repeat protein